MSVAALTAMPAVAAAGATGPMGARALPMTRETAAPGTAAPGTAAPETTAPETTGSATPAPELFGSSDPDPGDLPPPRTWELRRRQAPADWKVLLPLCTPEGAGAPQDVTLGLFPDTTVVARPDRIRRTGRADSVRWQGDVPGVTGSQVTLMAVGLCGAEPDRTVLAGSARFGDREFTIQPRPRGRVLITEIDPIVFGRESRPDQGTGQQPPPATTPSPSPSPSPRDGSGARRPPGNATPGARRAHGTRRPQGTRRTRTARHKPRGHRVVRVRRGPGTGRHGGARRARSGRAASGAARSGPGTGSRGGGVRAAAAGKTLVDALILYTPGAQARAGGKDEIEAWIYDAVIRADDSMTESGVNAEFRVVGMRQVPYTGVETVEPAFDHLAAPADGRLDEAAELRRQTGADVVTVVVAGYDPVDRIAGLADYVMNPRSSMTGDQSRSVVAADQLWSAVLAHEWGHLLGLDHDWVTSPRQNPYYPDAHGHLAADGTFVTIMGYPSACGRPCGQVPYFANPSLSLNGRPLGVRLGQGARPADNVRVMNLTAPQVAGYRAAQVPLPDKVLRLSASPAGSGSASVGTPGPYSAGEAVTATAAPRPGYRFAGWTLDGDEVAGGPALTLTMDTDHTLVARFAADESAGLILDTTVTPGGTGTVTLKPPGTLHAAGTAVTATAVPRPGHAFAGWTLDGLPAGGLPVLTVRMDRRHALAARFRRLPRLTVRSAPAAGGRAVILRQVVRPTATDIVVRATAARRHRFRYWSLGGRPAGTRPVVTVRITGDQVLTAVFARR